ncbi:hypothetical protein U1Q18_005020 [Sarracenia purpurea var. burkii]
MVRISGRCPQTPGMLVWVHDGRLCVLGMQVSGGMDVPYQHRIITEDCGNDVGRLHYDGLSLLTSAVWSLLYVNGVWGGFEGTVFFILVSLVLRLGAQGYWGDDLGRAWGMVCWQGLVGGSEGILKDMVDSGTHYFLVIYCIFGVCLASEFRQLSLSSIGGFKLLFERPCVFCYNLDVFPKSCRWGYGLFAAITFVISSLCSSKEGGHSGFLLGFVWELWFMESAIFNSPKSSNDLCKVGLVVLL